MPNLSGNNTRKRLRVFFPSKSLTLFENPLLKVCAHGREKYVSEFVSKSGLNTRFYLTSHRYFWYGYHA
jgi:hypothetical protein